MTGAGSFRRLLGREPGRSESWMELASTQREIDENGERSDRQKHAGRSYKDTLVSSVVPGEGRLVKIVASRLRLTNDSGG